jgi:hypothetical protein
MHLKGGRRPHSILARVKFPARVSKGRPCNFRPLEGILGKGPYFGLGLFLWGVFKHLMAGHLKG